MFARNELFANDLAPMRAALVMTATVVISGLLVWASLRGPRSTVLTGLVFVILGGLAGYVWPISFALGLTIPDVVTEWTFGPALPPWQGMMTMVIGVAMMLRRVPVPPAVEARTASVEATPSRDIGAR